MTYEEAKMQIQAIPEKIWDQLSEPDREAMEMAFYALQAQGAKTQLSAEGTTSDCISRQEAVDAIGKASDELYEKIKKGATFPQRQWLCGMAQAQSILENLPSAQPETAKRIVGKSRGGMTLRYQCDMCNEPVDVQDNYCRGCGRRLTDG